MALADGRLVAEFTTVRRWRRVFRGNAEHVPTDHVERIDGVGLAIADEVGAVEIDTDSFVSEVFDTTEQHNRRFLSRLETEIHSPPSAMRADPTQRGDHFRVQGLVRIFGYEP